MKPNDMAHTTDLRPMPKIHATGLRPHDKVQDLGPWLRSKDRSQDQRSRSRSQGPCPSPRLGPMAMPYKSGHKPHVNVEYAA